MEMKHRRRDFLLILLLLQFVVYATVIFDVPVARQVIGFAYLTFVPGFVIIRLLKLEEIDRLETFLFSVGLSVAFLMFVGLLVNEVGPVLGILQPLSLMPLMITSNGLILLMALLAYVRGTDIGFWSSKSLAFSPFVLPFLCLPILSVIGAIWVNMYDKNSILMFMIIAISVLFGIAVISKKLVPPKLYPFAVLMTAISLLFQSSLISNYIVGWGSDVGNEYFVFKTTINSMYWSATPSVSLPSVIGRLNSMLAVTILPTVYSTLLGIDPIWIFKCVFPLIFSLVPLVLHRVWSPYVGKKYAFISAFLFMAYLTFYTEMLGLQRQMIAELFFALLLLVILSKKMKPLYKMTFFVIFSFALITSHYSLATIFLGFISFAVIVLIIRSRILKKPYTGNFKASLVVIFFAIMFTWYIYTSSSAVFNSFETFGSNVINQLGDFSNPASRGATVLTGLGLEAAPTIWNSFSRAFAYVTEALIVIGFVGLILKKTKIRYETEYFLLSCAAATLLVATILVPGLANTLNETRFYQILLFFLAPFCVIGADVIVKLMSRKEKELAVCLLLLIVLVPYFLFQTGFVFEVAKSESGWTLPLSGYRMDDYTLYQLGYVNDYGAFGVEWMSKKIDVQYTPVYADDAASYELVSYRAIDGSYVLPLSNATEVSVNGTVYLNSLNVVDKTIVTDSYLTTTDKLSFLAGMSEIYSNGNVEIYRNNTGN